MSSRSPRCRIRGTQSIKLARLSRTRIVRAGAAVLIGLHLPSAALAAPQFGETTRASLGPGGLEAVDGSYSPDVSADGRFVAFYSVAGNLVPGDTNGHLDVFVRDRVLGQTVRASVGSAGAEADGDSFVPSMSAEGSCVAFQSFARNLAPGNLADTYDIFVHDSSAQQTTLVSVDSQGSAGNAHSYEPSISGDGRHVAFASSAMNLVPGDSNAKQDVFVHDRATGQTIRASVGSGGTQGNGNSSKVAISADGRFIAFESAASNLVSGDSNGQVDVFVHDRATGQTTRASVDSSGNQANSLSQLPALSGDGRFVAFHSNATNLVSGDVGFQIDIFVHDHLTGHTELVSRDALNAWSNGASTAAEISADGRFVAFQSFASDLVAGDSNFASDVFLHDRTTGLTKRVSVGSDGMEGYLQSLDPAISADGRFVVFYSDASNLVPNDTNSKTDVFVHDELDCTPETYCTSKVSTHACIPSIYGVGTPSLSDPSGFTLITQRMETDRNALTFFGLSGPGNYAFHGGFLCAAPPLYRLGAMNSGGAGVCQGLISYTLANLLATEGAVLTAGALVCCQTWGRDPGDLYGSSLSNAIQFQVCP